MSPVRVLTEAASAVRTALEEVTTTLLDAANVSPLGPISMSVAALTVTSVTRLVFAGLPAGVFSGGAACARTQDAPSRSVISGARSFNIGADS